MKRLLLPFAACLAANQSAPEMADLGSLRLDQVQYIETHNSYHLAPDPELTVWLERSGYADGAWTGARLARAIAYSDLPLTDQLELGIRAFELDVHDDPVGGRFARPGFLGHLRAAGTPSSIPWDTTGAMLRPGFKTLHKPDYDPRSTCPIFADCLSEIAGWSRAHPDHVPILLMLEVKRDGANGCAGLCAEGWRRLEGELAAKFPRSHVVTPTDIARGWPTIDRARGKILFFLLDAEDTAQGYRAATGANGLLFTGIRPTKAGALKPDGLPWAILPNPADPRIPAAIGRGMVVYTRADADTEQARSGDPSSRDRAFASGAQIVSTDYPIPDRRFSDYRVRFPGGGFVRCDPVTASKTCPIGRD